MRQLAASDPHTGGRTWTLSEEAGHIVSLVRRKIDIGAE